MSFELSVMVPSTANTEVLAAVTTGEVKSSPIGAVGSAFVDTDVDVFVVQDTLGTAAGSNCLRLLAGNQYRLHGIRPGSRLAFRAQTTNGSVRVTPGA